MSARVHWIWLVPTGMQLHLGSGLHLPSVSGQAFRGRFGGAACFIKAWDICKAPNSIDQLISTITICAQLRELQV